MNLTKILLLLILLSSCTSGKKEIPKNQIEKQEIKEAITDIVTVIKKEPIELDDPINWETLWDKAEEYRTTKSRYSTIQEFPADFQHFYERFITDSVYQKSHVDSNELIAVVSACFETTVLNSEDWTFDNWEFRDVIGIDEESENTFYVSDSTLFCEYILKEIGIIRQLGFEKKNNEWFLTLYFIEEC